MKWREDPQKIIDYRVQRRVEFREWVDALKLERGCADCGYAEAACALDFDHVRGEKKFNIGQAILRARAVIEAEIAKCDVVCAICHRIRTQARRVAA